MPCNFPLRTKPSTPLYASSESCSSPTRRRHFRKYVGFSGQGGVFIFNVWDRIEKNEFADTVTKALESIFPKDPPHFMARVPHGYFDRLTIERDLQSGGLIGPPQFTTVTARSLATSPRVPAIAYCQGTPLRNEIEARDPSRLAEATNLASAAIAHRFGSGAVDGKIRAHIIAIGK